MASTTRRAADSRALLACIYSPEAQTLGDERITLNENHEWKVAADGGVKKYHTLGQSALRFLNTQEGVFRFGQLGDRIPKFINAAMEHYGKARSVPLDNCTSKSLLSWTWLTTIPYVICVTPGTIGDIKDASNAWSDKSLSSQQRRYKIEKATRELTDTTAMYSYSFGNIVSLFPSVSHHVRSFIKFGDAVTLVKDVTSLKINAENLAYAYSVDTSKATRSMKETIEGTKRYAIAGLAKDVFAATSGIFAIFTGTSVLSAVTFAFLSMAETVSAVVKKMFEETMPYRPIHFLDNAQVTQVKV
jgi:hypothetical protein